MRTYMRKYLYKSVLGVLFVSLLSIMSAVAQTTVSGKVTDSSNLPLVGATVQVKGTTIGTMVDVEGRYTITIPANAEKALQFSFLGYKTIIKNVTGTRLDVVLEDDNVLLEDVVVVGYGTMRKSDITGSVASVRLNETEVSQVATFDKLLQGKAAGVQVITGNSAPGGAVSVQIRGTTSFNSSGEPLYIVDGIILNSVSQDVRNPIGSSGQEAQNALTSINPQDIASIEILKDASATAIYGSLGANGVILITTKSGNSDKPRIDWTTSVEIANSDKKIPILDLKGFLEYADAIGYTVNERDYLQEVDWQDYTMRTGVSSTHRLTVSGRGDKSRYYIAGGYLDNQGILKKTNVQQGDIRMNFDLDVTNFLRIGTKFTFTKRANNMTQGTEPGGTQNATRATNMMRQMLGSKPYIITDLAESYDDEEIRGTDIWLQNYDDISKEHRINAVVYADIKFTKEISFRTTAGADFRDKTRTRWYGNYIDNARNGRAGIAQLNALRWNIDNTLNFDRDFDKNNRLNFMVGTSLSSNLNKNSTVEANDFPDHEFRAGGIKTARSVTPGYSEDKSALISYYARGIYSLKDRYILTATYRADGSSKFSSDNKYSFFPSFAFAWRMNEEFFMKDLTFVTNLKLRLGWGQVGNQALSPYQTLTTYNSIKMADPNSNYDLTDNGSFLIGVKPSILANKMLRWETSEQTNIGLDVGLLKNRINITVDLYNKITKDLLQDIDIPPQSGFSNMWVNRGKIQNKGLELTVDGVLMEKRDFSWSLSGNISFNRNKVLELGKPAAQWGSIYAPAFLGKDIGNDNTYFKMPANIFIEGHPVALFYGFKTDGLVTEEDVASGNLPTYRGKPLQAGDIKYVNVNNENGLNDINDADKTIIGDPNPKFIYGFNNNISYKRFTFTVMFTGVYGNQVVNGNLLQEEDTAPSNPASNINNIRSEAFYNAWTPDNQNARYPRLRKTNNSGDFTDRIVEDGSYLRLSNLTLNYNVPLKANWIRSIGLSFTARNLFIITKYSGWDPDVNSFSSGSQKIGVDWGSYPSARSYLFGLSMSF